ncbi:MAG: sigma-70 family RNA polymerase sigma factor [Candidatus Didemnitutus sp.]|nr:sigma-70 family RNA polymerase sigma factor [Candidatus Didemnitutus sp.]
MPAPKDIPAIALPLPRAGAATENPPPPAAKPAQLVEHFFRHETGRLHGALIRLLGVNHMSLAEDIAQEAMMKALHTWSMGGVPANPSAWITRVAMNLAKDALRHKRMSGEKTDAIVTFLDQTRSPAEDTSSDAPEIRDDTLRLLFVCCHPSIAADAQVVLALKVLCGFSTGEIARAFLSSDAAIEKQLTRTKQRIADAGIGFDIPAGAELAARLDGVLATIYLLFNEGYKASAGDRLLREDLCHEAIRLTTLLVAHPAGDTPRSHALLALMLLTAARFPSRLDEHGDLLRLDDQDRAKWDAPLIGRGLFELVAAAQGTEISEYHLQAGIAAIHCTAPDYASTDWARILSHYDELLRMKPSPIVALNRAVAVAHLHGPRAGLDAIAAIEQRDRLENLYLLHAVVGELHWRLKDHRAAAASFRRALQLAHVGPEQQYLARMVERASESPGVN